MKICLNKIYQNEKRIKIKIYSNEKNIKMKYIVIKYILIKIC